MALLDWLPSFSLRLTQLGAVLLIAYLVSLIVYRLYLSPLAEFPGPKLAALTLWYEFYYDVVKQGRYTWRIGEMHEKYGPIVRINPYELHINDTEYYDELYTGPTKRRDKWAWSARMFGNSSSHFGTVPHHQHRMRRAPLNPFFSKQAVAKLEPMIGTVVEKLSERLRGFQQTKEPVNLRHAFAALTMDVVVEYAFAKSYNCLDEPDFAPIWPEVIDSISEQSHINKQFPWLLPVMRLLPLWLVARLNPHIMRLIRFQMDLADQVSTIMKGKNDDSQPANHQTIFQELLQTSDLPPEEKTLLHLVDEGQSVAGAGQVTTTHFLNTTAYHVIANPEILSNLRAELEEAVPDGTLAPLQKLEQLPYLSAVVNEGYRISYGITHRLQRVSPDAPLVYQGYSIPAGTPVSMTSVFMHDNVEHFPEPKAFRPQRWLDPKDRNQLGKYLVNFSKGTRGCLGQHLAQAEIYLTLAAVFRRFDMSLYQTTREDIDVAHDFFNPQPRKGSKGLRVIVN